MDTRLKKFKSSITVKLLCWLLAAALFCLTVMAGAKIIVSINFFGVDDFINKNSVSYYETDIFESMFYTDIYQAFELSAENESAYFNAINKQKDAALKDIKNDFLSEKANIIRNELIYAVENWDVSYYNYDYNYENEVTDVNITENTSDVSLQPGENNQSVTIIKPDDNYNIPESIKLAQQILATKSGLEFLDYEYLVRTDAFNCTFNTNVELLVPFQGEETKISFTLSLPMNMKEDDFTEYISNLYDESASVYYLNHTYYSTIEEDFLRIKSMKYYIVKEDGTVVSNVSGIPENMDDYQTYFMYSDREYKAKGVEYLNVHGLNKNNSGSFYLYFDGCFDTTDDYGKNYITYKSLGNVNSIVLVIVFLLLLIFSVFFIGLWLSLIGFKKNKETPELFFLDKIPNDIHLVLSFGLIASYICPCMLIIYDYVSLYSVGITDRVYGILGLISIGVFALFSEWLSSVSRYIKTKEPFFRKTFIYFIVKKICNVLKKFSSIFKYKPTHFKIQTILLFLGFLLVNLIFGVLTVCAYNDIFILFIVVCAVFDGFVGYCLARYVKNLDMIIQRTKKGERIVFEDNNKTSYSLLKLAENLNDQNKVLENAISEAVKKEQMKTQLITNVSHDLKTPLTSLINYSDLLTKCDIDDEQAKKYIETINLQSVKMKRLIEDLIEATKVSTGNVSINKVQLNLCELAVQAIVEFTPDLEKNRNEIRFAEPVNTPYIYADSVKTYRVLSNLFSNVRKYAAPDTRVYVDVYSENGFGIFEIKNISKEPLNIPADMLTERFVRGDESRTNEGNGLGLSIASDLCKLMGGSLEIIVDGDLFKAIVKLPE